VSADVGVLAAVPIEIGAFVARLAQVRKYSSARHTVVEGLCGPRLVALIVAGPGRAAAARAAELLWIGHRPRWLLSVGFAGGLDPELKRGQVVCPHELFDLEATRISVDVHVHESAAGPSLRSGRLVTVDHVVRTAADKAALRRQTNADAVDMESLAVARFCAERGIRFLCVRALSDDAHSDLPPEILSLVGPTGGYRLGAAVGAILKRPARLRTMFALREQAHQAARNLAAALSYIIPRLG
jgi:adenosylhomocysteine nucleosidase